MLQIFHNPPQSVILYPRLLPHRRGRRHDNLRHLVPVVWFCHGRPACVAKTTSARRRPAEKADEPVIEDGDYANDAKDAPHYFPKLLHGDLLHAFFFARLFRSRIARRVFQSFCVCQNGFDGSPIVGRADLFLICTILTGDTSCIAFSVGCRTFRRNMRRTSNLHHKKKDHDIPRPPPLGYLRIEIHLSIMLL